jgi:acyl carrier protein
MTVQEILTVFTRILRDLLLDDSIVLTMETRREDIPNWNSFNYINFIVAVEIEFGVKFKVADVESFRVLRVVATGQRVDHRPLYRHQLRLSTDPAATERGRGLAPRVQSGSLAGDRVQCRISRLF